MINQGCHRIRQQGRTRRRSCSPFDVAIYEMALKMSLDFHPKIVSVLVAALGAIACVSIRGFFIRRQFARRHGCQRVARFFNKDPFLGLDTIPGTLRAPRQHKILERSCELFRVYGNTFTIKELQRRAILTVPATLVCRPWI